MVRIAACDDHPGDLDELGSNIQKACDAVHIPAELCSFQSGEALLRAHREDPFQVVFLDVYMRPLTGIDVARGIRAQEDACDIIFITVSREHAIEGFEVRACHYLMKPVTALGIAEALERCAGGLTEALRTIAVKSGKLEFPVRLNDIESIEVFDKVSVIHTRRGEVRAYLPLDKLEAELGGTPFLRCHRCAIVNMRWIQEYTPTDFVMRSGRRIPIRRSARVSLRQRYLDFLFAQTRGMES